MLPPLLLPMMEAQADAERRQAEEQVLEQKRRAEEAVAKNIEDCFAILNATLRKLDVLGIAHEAFNKSSSAALNGNIRKPGKLKLAMADGEAVEKLLTSIQKNISALLQFDLAPAILPEARRRILEHSVGITVDESLPSELEEARIQLVGIIASIREMLEASLSPPEEPFNPPNRGSDWVGDNWIPPDRKWYIRRHEKNPENVIRLSAWASNIWHTDLPQAVNIDDIVSGEDRWDENDFGEFLLEKSHHGLVARHEGRIIGFVLFEELLGELHIVKMMIHPHFRRKRVGEQLMEQVKERMRGVHIQRIVIEAPKDDAGTDRFLRSQEFLPDEERPGWMRFYGPLYSEQYIGPARNNGRLDPYLRSLKKKEKKGTLDDDGWTLDL